MVYNCIKIMIKVIFLIKQLIHDFLIAQRFHILTILNSIWKKNLIEAVCCQRDCFGPCTTDEIRQSSISYAGLLGQMTDQPSFWCSKYILFFFHNFLQSSLQKSFQFIFLFFCNFTKTKIRSFECPKSILIMKK